MTEEDRDQMSSSAEEDQEEEQQESSGEESEEEEDQEDEVDLDSDEEVSTVSWVCTLRSRRSFTHSFKRRSPPASSSQA